MDVGSQIMANFLNLKLSDILLILIIFKSVGAEF
jgi:hypothetical protein